MSRWQAITTVLLSAALAASSVNSPIGRKSCLQHSIPDC
jgi:hypothetical protein